MKIKLSRFWILIRVISFLFFQVIGRTNRLIPLGKDFIQIKDGLPTQCIISLWHSHLMMPIYYFCDIGVSVLISKSEDGEIVTHAAQAMGIDVVRGSSSRSGARALLGMVRKLEEGKHTAITVDGPRGPKEEVQMGIIALAKLSGCPIMPAAFNCTRKKRLNSWDEFIVPYPFGKIAYVTGEYITVPKDADDALMEVKRIELENVMRSLTKQVNDYFNEQ